MPSWLRCTSAHTADDVFGGNFCSLLARTLLWRVVPAAVNDSRYVGFQHTWDYFENRFFALFQRERRFLLSIFQDFDCLFVCWHGADGNARLLRLLGDVGRFVF